MAFHRPSRYSRRGPVSQFKLCHLSLLRFDRVQSFARAFLSRSITSPSSRGLPLANGLVPTPSRPSHEVSYLSATLDGGSDLHWTYLVQLCCVLRLSQPLDALFRPHLFGLISCRYHPGLHLQSLSPRDSLVRLSTPSAPPAVSRCDPKTSSPQLQGFVHSRGPYLPSRCYPKLDGRSSPDVRPSEVSLTQSRRPYGCLLSWASALRRRRTEVLLRRRACSAEFQRTEESMCSFEPISPLGVFSPASAMTEIIAPSGLPPATPLR